MSTLLEEPITAAQLTGRRLLYGLTAEAADPSLRVHLRRWGALGDVDIVPELEASALVGHGGAWFPVAAKWRAVAAGRRRPVVVANGAEGEPASRKDALLLARAPHLVLDGLSLAAAALEARRAVAYVPSALALTVTSAVAERRARGLDPVRIEIVSAPDTYLAGQETAVVSALNGRRRAVPTFIGTSSIRERGVSGRPTLVQNVETLAHVALIGRFGASWFRETGAPDLPGTMLLTVTRSGGLHIAEAALGASLRRTCGIEPSELAHTRGVLLGGYGGGWVGPDTFADLPVSETAARAAGATLGPGIVALLSRDLCPLAEMADVVRYMEGQGAGQCGPCVHGLAELADSMERLAYHRGGAPRAERILELCALVEGRGACRHPDGVARFVRSGLSVFADEVASHQRRGPCTQTRLARLLPVPPGPRERRKE